MAAMIIDRPADDDGARRLGELGFDKLAENYADEAARALAAAKSIIERLPEAQDPALEPATIYVPIGAGSGSDDV